MKHLVSINKFKHHCAFQFYVISRVIPNYHPLFHETHQILLLDSFIKFLFNLKALELFTKLMRFMLNSNKNKKKVLFYSQFLNNYPYLSIRLILSVMPGQETP